jgi:hypothetical protein
MAGLDPAAKCIERRKVVGDLSECSARADARALGGRVKPGHDDVGRANVNRTVIPRPGCSQLHCGDGCPLLPRARLA